MNYENVDELTKITKGDGKCARKPVAMIFPTCVNRISVISNLKGSAEHSKEQERINLRLMENRQKGILKKKRNSKLTKKDVVVIWRGSHDIAKNATTKGLKHMVKFFRL
jgi:hypothetical protein